jgi:hypothetical protein
MQPPQFLESLAVMRRNLTTFNPGTELSAE